MNSHDACIALNLTPGIGPARASMLIEHFGSASAIFEQKPEDLCSVYGVNMSLACKIIESAGKPLDEELSRIERSNVHVMTLADDDYPESLRAIEDSPVCLYVCGSLPAALNITSVAIVGSRRPSVYGIRTARHLAESALLSGWTVISGLAIGIDAAAHSAVVDMKGRTVAVLGGGLANIQPREHVPLAKKIIENSGAIVSEYPMLFAPTRYSFPLRNRIISALSNAVVIVEAGLKSGALITAAAALEQGKQIFAVPGNIDTELSQGCNHLIKSGEAALITGFEDILRGTEFLPGFEPNSLKESSAEFNNGDPQQQQMFNEAAELTLNENDLAILKCLRESGDSTMDFICAKTQIQANIIGRKLIALELIHKIERLPDGKYRFIRM